MKEKIIKILKQEVVKITSDTEHKLFIGYLENQGLNIFEGTKRGWDESFPNIVIAYDEVCGSCSKSTITIDQFFKLLEEKYPKICGYDAEISEQDNSFIRYGCKETSFGYIRDLITRFEDKDNYAGNLNIKAIKLDTGDEVTVKQLKEIIKARESQLS